LSWIEHFGVTKCNTEDLESEWGPTITKMIFYNAKDLNLEFDVVIIFHGNYKNNTFFPRKSMAISFVFPQVLVMFTQ
jgi:hypothetical protein